MILGFFVSLHTKNNKNMKRFILLLMATMTMAFSFAQDEPEKSSPSWDTEIVRRCSNMNIEGERFDNVVITLKSYDKNSEPFLGIKGGPRVKVTVKNNNGKKVYKKIFKNCYLYIFSDGEVRVGKPKFNQIIIDKIGRSWYGEIKEKEGIW